MSKASYPDIPRKNGSDLIRAEAQSRAVTIYDSSMGEDLEADTIDLREYWKTLVKRRSLILGIVASALIFGFISTLIAVPMYRAVALVQVQDNPRLVQYDNLGNEGPGMSRDSPFFYNTQLAIIRSSSVAAAVVESLGIQDHPDVNGERRQRSLRGELGAVLGSVLGGFSGRQVPRELDEDARQRLAQERAVMMVKGRSSVSQVRNSRLFQIGFDSFDRQFAVEVTNELVKQYARFELDQRSGSGGEARRFLQEQIDEMRLALDQSDQALVQFSRNNGIANFGDRLEQSATGIRALNEQLAVVQLEKVRLDALRDQIDSGRPIENLDVVSENETIRELRNQYTVASAEYAVLSDRFLEGYPALSEIRSRMNALESTLRTEIQRIADGTIARHENLLAQESALSREIASREATLLELNQQAVQYNVLQRDFETNNELYDGLLQRLKEVGVAENIQRENINLVEPARGAFQVYPRRARTLALALLFGLVAGVGVALLLEFLDNTVKNPDDMEKISQRPVLGLIPLVKIKENVGSRKLKQPARQVGHYSARHPRSAVSEAFRSLRTSLMFSTPGGMPKVILVTSPAPGDGKTTCAINLATVLAQNGGRVLLVDADLRKPRIHRDFGKASSPGLTNRLTERSAQNTMSGTISGTDVPGLFLMTAGTLPPNPAELLGSGRMAAILAGFGKVFDHVIVDCAPIIGIADALVVSRYVDGVILVAASGITGKDNTRMAVKRLRQVDAPLLGTVLNAVDMTSPDYAYYSQYYYNYSSDNEDEPVQSLPKTA